MDSSQQVAGLWEHLQRKGWPSARQCACLSMTKAADPADEELDPAQKLDGAKSILQLKQAADATGSAVQVTRAVDITRDLSAAHGSPARSLRWRVHLMTDAGVLTKQQQLSNSDSRQHQHQQAEEGGLRCHCRDQGLKTHPKPHRKLVWSISGRQSISD